MPRNISFSMTEPQFLDGSKDVTRRLGWLKLKPHDLLMACRKCMGLKKGEKVHRLGLIKVITARRERLDAITQDEVRREGFPDMSVPEFIEFFCKGHRGCKPETVVTRIEFQRLTSTPESC
ncbi:MAG: hypothetical protein ACR2PF_06725 [Rhizobiaceae bacterium]